MVQRHAEQGAVLRRFTVPVSRALDWYREVGHYLMIKDQRNPQLYSRMLHRRTLSIKDLPKAFQAYEEELGEVLTIFENHLERKAYLRKTKKDGTTKQLVFSETIFAEEVKDKTVVLSSMVKTQASIEKSTVNNA